METISALLALYEENPPVIGGFPSQGPVTFDISFEISLSKLLDKQSRGAGDLRRRDGNGPPLSLLKNNILIDAFWATLY